MSLMLRLTRAMPRWMKRAGKQVPGSNKIRAAMAGKPGEIGPPPGAKRAVVYLPTWVKWDVMRQRPQYILMAFARAGFPVYFVDPSEPKARTADGVRIVPSVRQVPSSGVLLYTHFAPLRPMFDQFHDRVIVYDILDDMSIYDADEEGVPEQNRVSTHHPEVVRRAQIVTASNEILKHRHRGERSDIVVVENGVEPSLFENPPPRPADLPPIGQPLIGYVGAVASWFDFKLVAKMALQHHEWNVVVVGPVAPDVKEIAAKLARIPNVWVMGERPSDAIPAYVCAFDVGIIPFQVNRMTEGVTPLKMYEYLAAGKPCVATPLPACVAEEEVRTAADFESFGDAVEASLYSHYEDVRMRKVIARRASWDKRIEPLLERLVEKDYERVIAAPQIRHL